MELALLVYSHMKRKHGFQLGLLAWVNRCIWFMKDNILLKLLNMCWYIFNILCLHNVDTFIEYCINTSLPSPVLLSAYYVPGISNVVSCNTTLDIIIILILQTRNWGEKRLRNLPRVTQLVSSGAWIWTQLCLSYLIFLFIFEVLGFGFFVVVV